MLLIPEIETVVILVPRTGSGTLYRAAMARYPKAMLVYRHMEADGVPRGYDRWRRIGVVREPSARLWSLYNYLQNFGKTWAAETAYATWMRRSVERSFEDWLLHNKAPFACVNVCGEQEKYHPLFQVNHSMPETRKSQFVYLRPDLGTEVFQFSNLAEVGRALDIDMDDRQNVTGTQGTMPTLACATWLRLGRIFQWDFAITHTGAPHG